MLCDGRGCLVVRNLLQPLRSLRNFFHSVVQINDRIPGYRHWVTPPLVQILYFSHVTYCGSMDMVNRVTEQPEPPPPQVVMFHLR